MQPQLTPERGLIKDQLHMYCHNTENTDTNRHVTYIWEVGGRWYEVLNK